MLAFRFQSTHNTGMADFHSTTYDEFTPVSLVRPIDVQGIHMPAGARGVIMTAWADGLAYEVEFDAPRHVLLTVEAKDLIA
jgi:hypothetical protein